MSMRQRGRALLEFCVKFTASSESANNTAALLSQTAALTENINTKYNEFHVPLSQNNIHHYPLNKGNVCTLK